VAPPIDDDPVIEEPSETRLRRDRFRRCRVHLCNYLPRWVPTVCSRWQRPCRT